MTQSTAGTPRRSSNEMHVGKVILLVVFLAVTFAIIGASLWPAAWIILAYGPKASTSLHWVWIILAAILAFNLAYVACLLALRIIIPKHKEGEYALRSDGRPPAAALVLMLNMMLFKLRFAVPWAPLFTAVLVVLPPISFFYRRLFGPNPMPTTLGDTLRILDPHLLKVGKRVTFGWSATVVGHVFDNRRMLIKGVEVGDDALIGGGSWLLPGVKVGHHAMVTAGAMVLPGTVIGPYEIWGGIPAKKIGEVSRPEQVSGD